MPKVLKVMVMMMMPMAMVAMVVMAMMMVIVRLKNFEIMSMVVVITPHTRPLWGDKRPRPRT